MNTHDRFKDAQLVTDQPIRFKSDRVKFIISNMPDKWRIKSINSPEVGFTCNISQHDVD